MVGASFSDKTDLKEKSEIFSILLRTWW